MEYHLNPVYHRQMLLHPKFPRFYLSFLAILLFAALSVSAEIPPIVSLRQGDPALLRFPTGTDLRGRRAELKDASGKSWERTKIFSLSAPGEPVRAAALFPIAVDLPIGDYEVVVDGGAEVGVPPVALRVEAGIFVSEDIRLDAGNTALRRVPDPKKEAQWIAIKAIYDRVDPDALYMTGRFGLPAGPARRSAFFGDKRRYLYFDGMTDTSVHSGIDFAVQSGTPVLAPARGKIVFEGKRIVTGLTLVLEHLPGMYSVFMHLSAFVARTGSVVGRGDILARSGNTGMSTGPHLHWEIRVGGAPVNPDFFVAHSVSDPEGR